MKTQLLTILMVLFTFGICSGQRIEVKKTNFGYVYKMYETKLNLKQLEIAVEKTPEALLHLKKAKQVRLGANMIGFVGGGLIGWEIGEYIREKEFNHGIAALGTLVTVASFIVDGGKHKHVVRAIDIHNAAQPITTRTEYVPSYGIRLKNNGVSFMMQF